MYRAKTAVGLSHIPQPPVRGWEAGQRRNRSSPLFTHQSVSIEPVPASDSSYIHPTSSATVIFVLEIGITTLQCKLFSYPFLLHNLSHSFHFNSHNIRSFTKHHLIESSQGLTTGNHHLSSPLRLSPLAFPQSTQSHTICVLHGAQRQLPFRILQRPHTLFPSRRRRAIP